MTKTVAEIAEGQELAFGGLTADEWVHVAQIITRRPRLGAATASQSQALVVAINGQLRAHNEGTDHGT